MRHGFKANAERTAASIRAELGLQIDSPLCPWQLADHFGVCVFLPTELQIPLQDLHQLTKVDPDSWSGLTVRAGGMSAVVLNSSHPRTRQRNTLMHELAHIYLDHVGSRVDVTEDGILLVSDFSAEQEDEANWLAGALLAPREALLTAKTAGKSAQQICKEFGISPELCAWRLRMTGVDAQLHHRRRKAS